MNINNTDTKNRYLRFFNSLFQKIDVNQSTLLNWKISHFKSLQFKITACV